MAEPHEQSIARITELARKRYPEAVAYVAVPFPRVVVYLNHDENAQPIIEVECALGVAQETALRMVEAALCVLVDEPPRWVVQLAAKWRREADRWTPEARDDANAYADELLKVAKRQL